MDMEKLAMACPKCRSTRIYVMMKVSASRFVSEVYISGDGELVVNLVEGTAIWEDEEYEDSGEETVYRCADCEFKCPQSKLLLYPRVCDKIKGAFASQMAEGLRYPSARAAIADALEQFGYILVEIEDATC